MLCEKNQNDKKSSHFKEIQNSIKEVIDMLEQDFIQFQGDQKLLIEYLQLQCNMKSRSEDEQQPLQEDVNLIDDNIKNLKIKAEEIKCSIKFGFNNLRSLQIELDESLEKYQAKATDAPTDTNAAIDTNAPTHTDSHKLLIFFSFHAHSSITRLYILFFLL
ncbi:unnamed protein product [Rotaria sp. Silwood2]|nr:unnamed protein product [Rotaria sp. Silwood2]CAF3358709.1 unnamed protein product [Rotaria sp. Silwood2]CAF4493161.1 unnamed protein product [Rotaria sp. Silwood2]